MANSRSLVSCRLCNQVKLNGVTAVSKIALVTVCQDCLNLENKQIEAQVFNLYRELDHALQGR